jgi:hypothetical protein
VTFLVIVIFEGFVYIHITYMGQDSSVGIATRSGLDGLRIESQWGGKNFRTCPASRTAGTRSSLGVK